MAGIRVIGSNICHASGDTDRSGEINLLPAARGLIGEGGAPKQGAVCGPEITDVSSGVLRSFVETNAGDLARHGGNEFDAKLNRAGIVVRDHRRRIGNAEECQIGRRRDGVSNACAQCFQIQAVVDSSGLEIVCPLSACDERV